MALTPRLELRQTQTLIMTPQLQQAIKLLQMSNLELGRFLETELQRNPLLSLAESEGPEDLPTTEVDPSPPDADNSLLSVDRMAGDELTGAAENALDLDVENRFDEDRSAGETLELPSRFEGAGGDTSQGPDSMLENTVGHQAGLTEILIAQIGLAFADDRDRSVAALMLEHLDEAGYFTTSADDIAAISGHPADQVEAILAQMQRFDPPGIFARNLAECLALQLADVNRLDPAMIALLDNLDLLAKGDLKGLVRRCALSEEEVRDMVDEIRALDPKPAMRFRYDDAQTVVPDILMRRRGNGWLLELNPETLPRVLVDRSYYVEVSDVARSPEDRQFLSDCLQSANWLVKSLHQRATTILKVAEEILRAQPAFFTHGVGHLRPLVLRDVAQAIEMHESTVSRVTSNKYIATPHGVFELKYFFSSSVGGAMGQGDAHSAESVKARIKAMIADEPPDKVLSDDQLVHLLKALGMDVARRTVAKYREALGIPSSVRRRRQKSMAR